MNTTNQQPVRGEYYDARFDEFFEGSKWYHVGNTTSGKPIVESAEVVKRCGNVITGIGTIRIAEEIRPLSLRSKIEDLIFGNLPNPTMIDSILSLVQNSGELTVREVCEKLKKIEKPYASLVIYADESNSFRYEFNEQYLASTNSIADLTAFVRKEETP